MPDSSSSDTDLMAANLEAIRQRIDQAAARSGRPGDQVALVGVCKYIGTEMTGQLLAAGCHQLGENRPQQLWEKAGQLEGRGVEWHMIGHLQRNKVRRTLPLISRLHSGDSLRLLQAVNEEASRLGQSLSVLLEVNVSGDESKHGFQPDQMPEILEQVSTLEFLDVEGLMTMASLAGGSEQARRDFSSLRELRDNLRQSCPDKVQLDDLSMGMSGDFEVAIEEGATLVRVGSALFEGIDIPGRAGD
jgi:pyridoxal phosphate enzyme (YggS family)